MTRQRPAGSVADATAGRTAPAQRKPRRKPAKADAGLVRRVLDLCRLMGVTAWRSNSGKVEAAHGGWVTLAPAGTPDVLAVLPPHGRLVGIEAKRPGGRVRPAQREWIARMAALGVRAIVTDSAAEAMGAIERWRAEDSRR